MRKTWTREAWTRQAWTRLASAAAVVAVLASCVALKPEGVMERDEIIAALRERGLDPQRVIHPMALTDEMRAWVQEAAESAVGPLEKLAHLQASLLDPSRIQVEYAWGYTGTAVEVFENRRANCLAFTNLFVGMARELGVPVYYLGVRDVSSYRKEGDLVVVSDHIAVGYGLPSDRKVFDFSENPPDDYANFRVLSDLTAIAMFHSNRGAETLQAGYPEDAVTWLEMAVEIDPSLGNAWINLGVARRRQGDFKGAERAYRQALDVDPRLFSAYQNLAALLRLQGRLDEARAYEELLAESPSRNPYTYVSLGDISLKSGRTDEAEILYRRAVKLSPDDPEVYAALGELAVTLGKTPVARRMLRKAQKLDDGAEHPRVERLAELLDRGVD